MTDPEPAPEEPPREAPVVPAYDVTRCIVCGRPMEARKCRYICRSCGTMIDCSDAY
jgi:hypothetical protein